MKVILKMIDLKGKRILITGASSGIGKQVAIQVASFGAKVIAFGRDLKRLDQTLTLLEGEGHEIYSIDLAQDENVERLIKDKVRNSGSISGLVHCAGIEKTCPFKATTRSVFSEIFAINVFAGFELARVISQKGVFNEKGSSFVFISSVMGELGEIGKIAYCSSKSALSSGVKAMALELAGKKIRCNCVLPGMVKTEMAEEILNAIPEESKSRILYNHPLGIGAPADVASLVCFLLSDDSSWITGTNIVIDGGYSAH